MTVRNPIVWITSAGQAYLSEAPSGDQIQFPNGALTTPGVTFRGSNSTGWWYASSELRASIVGVLRLTIAASGITVVGDVNAVKGVFSGDVSGVKGTFSSDVSGVKGIFSGDVSGVKGTFSGDVSGVVGNFTGNIQSGGVTVIDTNRAVQLRVFTVATLPATPANGLTAFVSDSTLTMTAGIGLAVVGGGANNVPVYSDAGTWKIG